MIRLTKLRELLLSAPPSTGRPAHLGAASGLARVGNLLYVVADDEHHIGIFRLGSSAPGRLLRIFAGELPAQKSERKAQKPDLEALTVLPPSAENPHGALLAIASGSKARRRKGALLMLDAQGNAGGVRECDLSGAFAALEKQVPKLNIEGAFVDRGDLYLLQRGNRGAPQSGLLRYELSAFLASLESGARIAPKDFLELELGAIEGVVLSPTDGASLPDGDFVFSAVAEDTNDSYRDGPCVGAALGIAGCDGRVRALWRLEHPHKIEGIDASVDGDTVRLLLVTDADDPATAACLYTAWLPRPG
jgi:uncharacterized protein DUF6929